MNKKLFLGMFAAAGMLFATSCMNDELDIVQSGNEAQVTFSLGLEGGISTRAISDGTKADKLVYAVYKLNANGEPELQPVVGSDANSQFVDNAAFDNGLTETVEITLAKGQTYQVAFWAQNTNCTAYTTTDLTKVGVSYDNAANNDENRDAFFKMVEFEVAGDKSIDVVMKRPFAQINVGVTAEDWEATVASGIEIKNSDVVIKNAATSINLLTGAISGEQDVTYTINAIPAEDLMVDADGDGTKEAYHWLSMSYILVNDTHDVDEDKDGTIGDYRTNLESLEYTFTPASGNAIEFAEGLNNVPVQRNWRTNILGKILTGDIQFNITIDPVYDGDINVEDNWADGYSYDETTGTYHVYTAEGLKAVAKLVDEATDGFVGKTILLEEDIDLYKSDGNGNPICFDPIGSYRKDKAFKGIFDGQNHTISNMSQNTWALDNGYYYSDLGMGLFAYVEDATIKNLIMDNANISGENGLCGIVAATAYGECVFENITVKNSKCNDYQYYAGGIVGWASGNHTFKNCNIDASTIVGGQWGDFGNNNGGVIGGIGGSTTILLKDCNVACRIDAVNDVVSAYQFYAYRCCGMLIGNTNNSQTIDGKPYAAAPQLTCENVTVTYGDWMNYTYCEFAGTGFPYVRVQAGVSVDAYSNIRYGHPTDANGNIVVDDNHVHNAGEDHHICLPFDQLLGGGPNGNGRNPVYGLASFPGVTVHYPLSYAEMTNEVSDAASLKAALEAGKNAILTADVDYGTTQLALDGSKIDLNGHTLTTNMTYGGISMKNGASIKNGTIEHTSTVAAIKAFNVGEIENVTIKTTCATTNKEVTAIAVQQGGYVGAIKNVNVEGVSQGIEVGYQATVDQIEGVTVNMKTNGTKEGIGLVINGGRVGKAKGCTFTGEAYGIKMHLKGVFAVALELEDCDVTGATASISAYDEKGISNTSGSLNLTYDAATTLNGPFVWDFEDECKSVVTLNQPL